MKEIKHVIGTGGGGQSSSTPRTPVEDPNTLQANTIAKIIDLIGEGVIGGPANDGDWYKSTYLNEIPIKNSDDSLNYNGVTLEGRTGTSTQEYLNGFNSVDTETSVSTAVTIAGGPITRTITDSNVDDVYVTISIPTLISQASNGDIEKTTIQLRISVTPDNGSGTKQTAISETSGGKIYGKCISEYRKQFIIENLAQYGSSPWVITVERITADSGSAKLVNGFTWYSYTTSIQTKLRYYDRSVIGLTLDGSQFGDNMPTRAYKVNGRVVSIPSNYDPDTRTYSGDWDGKFTTGVTNNPAWIVYDLLTNVDVGLGNIITEDMVDKWSLYTCGVYCDTLINYTTKRMVNGAHTTVSGSEHRFSFNGVIENRVNALEIITHMSSVMRAYPVWAGGQVTFVQDKPITTTARPVGLSNISEEGFEYQGVPRRNRHSVVKVSWNDPALLGRLDTIELVDEQSIRDFGYNEINFDAFGCTSRTEAIRRGNYVLDTDINAREIVGFKGGLEWADAIPGTLITVQDPNYTSTILEGRVKSGTTTSLVLDKSIVIANGVTYTMFIQTAEGEAETRELTNSAATTANLTWDTPLSAVPFRGAQLVISASNLSTRDFVIVSIVEESGSYKISAVEYDAGKYARIESGIVAEQAPTTGLLADKLTPPTNINVEAYTYTTGDQALRLFGIQISWVHSIDPRVGTYELRYKPSAGGWQYLGETNSNSYDWKPVVGDTYDISVRGKGVGITSEWLTYTDFVLNDTLTNLAPPTNLDTLEGGGLFSGKDCTVTWSGSIGSEYASTYDDSVGDSNVAYYKVEVREPDTTLIRAFDTAPDALSYTYTYNQNVLDNGDPLRSLLFYVYSADTFGELSATYASVVASNPAPDMSAVTLNTTAGPTYVQLNWNHPTDNDMSHYVVFWDTSTDPSANSETVVYPSHETEIFGLSYGTTYYFKVVPYDFFGIGTSTGEETESPNQIPSEDIDIELSASIVMTDSESNTATTLAGLYDGVSDSGGIAYNTGGWAWIEYDFGIETFINGVQIWDAAATAVCVAYSRDGATWSYLSGDGSHDLTLSNGQLRLTSRASLALAQTNYWTTDAAYNYAFFPNGEVARYCRLYLNASSSKTIYELVFRRIVVAEDIAVENLGAISADIGSITAGNIQSSDYSGTEGMRIDLNNKDLEIRKSGVDKLIYDGATGSLTINGVVTFQSSSSGYANITDKPTSLAGINSTEGTKLTGIATGADVTASHTAAAISGQGSLATRNSVDFSTQVTGATKPANNATVGAPAWEHPTDVTKIDGGNLSVGSVISLAEGGTIIAGDYNIQIRTVDGTNDILVAPDGGIENNDYLQITNGSVYAYYWNGTQHVMYKSLTRIETGIASNNEWVTIPGIFKAEPKVSVTQNKMPTFVYAYRNQSQSMSLEVADLQEVVGGSRMYKFRAISRLELSSGNAGTTISLGSPTAKVMTKLASYGTATTPQFTTLEPNTRRLTVNGTVTSSMFQNYTIGGENPSRGVKFFRVKALVRLYYYEAGVWKNTSKTITTVAYSATSVSFDTGTVTGDITKFYMTVAYAGYPSDYYTTGTVSVVNLDDFLGYMYGTYGSCRMTSYTSDLASTAIIANGTLNWMAVGE